MQRELQYATTLSKMIQCRTVSCESQTDLSCFVEFQTLLKESFPSLFKVSEFENYNGSFTLKWKGKTSDKPVLFMNHQDVVPAQDGWSCDPFSGEIKDGKLWGRGTLDTKGGLFAMLQAANELAEKNYVPKHDVWFASSCCEEIDSTGQGCELIAKTLQKRGIRFEFVLDEGGMIVYEPIGGAKSFFALVGVSEKGASDLKFTAKSTGGHASSPEKDSPLVRLGKFMAEADSHKIFTVYLNDVSAEMLKRMSVSMKGVKKILLGHPRLFKNLLQKVMPELSGTANAMVRTTLAFTRSQGSEANNVLPSEAFVIGNMRFSHHQGQEDSLRKVTDLATKYGIETEVIEKGISSPISSYSNSYFKLIEEAVFNNFENVITTPYIQLSASDSRYMSIVSDNIYRLVPFKINNQQLASIHGIDENVDISTLAPAVDFYKYIMENF